MKKLLLTVCLILLVFTQLVAQEKVQNQSLLNELDSMKKVLRLKEMELKKKTEQIEEQLNLMEEKEALRNELRKLEKEIEEVEALKYDTTTYIFGKKKLTVLDKKTGKSKSIASRRVNQFMGAALGVNGFLSENHHFNLQKEAGFMEIEYQKSISLSLYTYEHYFPLIREKLGIATAIGVEFNNYSLDRNISIASTKDSTFGVESNDFEIDKNRLKSTVINLPMVFETNLGRSGEKSIRIAAGGMVSYRLGAKTKQIRIENGEEFKIKNRTDFNMNPFLFSAVGRIGYGNFTFFTNISLTSLYDTDNGPEIFPISMGIHIAVID